MNDVQIVILAGGKGTRLRERIGDKPKPMAMLGNYTLIEHQMKLCASQGFRKFKILSSYKSEQLWSHIETTSDTDWDVEFVIDTQPLGTGGALFNALDTFSETIIVLYGDTYLTVDLTEILKSHTKYADRNSFLGCLLVHPNSHPHDSDMIEVDAKGWVTAFRTYPHNDRLLSRNLANAALYTIKTSKLREYSEFAVEMGAFDIARDFFPVAVNDGIKLKSVKNTWFIKDCGTPARIDHVERLISDNAISKFSSNRPKPFIFIDRDGTINQEVSYITKPEQLKLLPGSAKAISNFNSHGLPVICVTNQPVIARGEASIEELNDIHCELEMQLGSEGAFLNDILFCPHHPDAGYPKEITELKVNCDCRKPSIGMGLLARSKWMIDFESSWMIGDTTTDIKFAENLGMRSVLVLTGFRGNDSKENCVADFVFNDLLEASKFITNSFHDIYSFLEKNISKVLHKNLFFISGEPGSSQISFSSALRCFLSDLGKDAVQISTKTWLDRPADSSEFNHLKSVTDFSNFLNTIKLQKFPIYLNYKKPTLKNNNSVQFNHIISDKTKILITGQIPSELSEYNTDAATYIWVDTSNKSNGARFVIKEDFCALNLAVENRVTGS